MSNAATMQEGAFNEVSIFETFPKTGLFERSLKCTHTLEQKYAYFWSSVCMQLSKKTRFLVKF
jgi:hypothetical protein